MNTTGSESDPQRQPSLFTSIVVHPYFPITFIVFFSLTLIFTKLGGNGLANYDDCFYAEKAKEILQTGEWMTMHYNHRPAFENPPFYLWLTAISYNVFGISEFAAKFPSALMGMGTILLVYFFGRTLFDSWTGFAGSLVLSTTFIFIRYARHAMFDVTLSFFVCLALFFLVIAIKKNEKYFLLWGICIGICVLIKSVLGFFPLAITIIYLLLTRRWRILFSSYFIIGGIILFIIGCSWYLNQYGKFGNDFLHVHFGWLIFQRGFQSQSGPWYEHLSYVEDLLKYYLPWLPLLVVGIVKCFTLSIKRHENALLLLLWLLVIFMTMSMMTTRVLWYIMPIFPAAAMIVGIVLADVLKGRGRLIFQKISLGIGLLTFIVLVATPVQLEAEREKSVRIIAPIVKHFADNGTRVIAFRCDYYGLNNALLFYSNHAASPIVRTFEEADKALGISDTVLCVVSPSDIDNLMNAVQGLHIIKKPEELVLVSNKSLDITGINEW